MACGLYYKNSSHNTHECGLCKHVDVDSDEIPCITCRNKKHPICTFKLNVR